MVDKFDEEESWGRKKFVNAKKPETEEPSKESPPMKGEPLSPDSPQDTSKKPKQFLDRNNMFSLLPKN